MPDFGCFAYLSILQNRLSIRVPLLFENFVGSVMCGLKLFDINMSTNSPTILFSFILRILILKSNAKMISEFVLSFNEIIK